MTYVIQGRCRECNGPRFSTVPTRDREQIEKLFRTISDYFCQSGDHWVFNHTFLGGHEWGFNHIEPLGRRRVTNTSLTPATA